MTTAAEIKALTVELRERDPRLVLVGRLLVIRPCTHWIRGLFFERSGNKNHFQPMTLVQSLYRPRRGLWLGLARQVYGPVERGAPSTYWELDWPNCARLVTDLAIEELLPEVAVPDSENPFNDLDQRGKHVFPGDKTDDYFLTMALSGDLKGAARKARQFLDVHEEAPWAPVEPEERRRRERLAAIFDSGQERTNRVLRAFERVMARRLGVEKWWHWEPMAGS